MSNVTSVQFPRISVNPIERARNRSSLLKQRDIAINKELKSSAQAIWQAGFSLLLDIRNEVASELNAIWARKDAEEFAKESATPKLDQQTLAALNEELDKPTMGISKFRQTAAERAAARREIAELAAGAKI